MKILTSAQCRAARGLLNWSQADLAKHANAHVQTISNFEKDAKIPSRNTLESIFAAFQLYGIELVENKGVTLTDRGIRLLKGHEGFCLFFDLVYEEALNNPNANLSVNNVDEDEYVKWLRDYDEVHIHRMAKSEFKVRALVKEGDFDFPLLPYVHYKWVPKKIFADVSVYFLGNKTAFIEFQENNVEVTLVDNPAVTKAMRKLFELSWEASFEMPQR